jgi:hypothetical protein
MKDSIKVADSLKFKTPKKIVYWWWYCSRYFVPLEVANENTVYLMNGIVGNFVRTTDKK